MDTKMQALKKAQKKHQELVAYGLQSDIFHLQSYGKFVVSVDNKVVHEFVYSDPKPLEKDTLCLCGDGVMRYAKGELSEDGVNKFYAQGFCSKNVGRGYHHYTFNDFEIIETPVEFERVQPTINMCLSNRCIYFDPRMAKCRAENPDECTVLVGKPSKLKSEKR